jgi:hypothetical protein
MKTFLKSLLSRKFIIAVCSVIALFAAKQYDQAIIVALGYMGINVVDTKVRK